MVVKIFDPERGDIDSDLRHVFDYWESIRGNNPFPAWTAFDWMNISMKIIPMCTVVDVVGPPLNFIYRFWGTSRTNIQGVDLTGRSIHEVKPEELSQKSFGEYLMVFETGKPIYFETIESDRVNGSQSMYKFLRLPFGGETNQVRAIFTASSLDWLAIKKVHDIY